MVLVAGGKVTIRSRGGHDWTTRYPEIYAQALSLPNCILDGEACVLGTNGTSDFRLLCSAWRDGHPIVYRAFDCLSLGGEDIRGSSLVERKQTLARLLSDRSQGAIEMVPHFEDGFALGERVRRAYGEGIVAKRKTALYQCERSRDWRKIKFKSSGDFLIAGWTPTVDGMVNTITIAELRSNGTRQCSRVGSGFSYRDRLTLAPILRALEATSPPQPGPSLAAVRPLAAELFAQLEYAGRTSTGVLRHPVWLGLREDLRHW